MGKTQPVIGFYNDDEEFVTVPHLWEICPCCSGSGAESGYEEEDEVPGREATLGECDPKDFAEAVSAALNSANNPDMLAGSGLFVHTNDAVVTSIDWK